MSFDLITIGESLIELSTNKKLGDSDYLQKYYGGDSLVVALAAKRLNSKVGFITCLGDDSFKDFLLDSWKNEGLDTSFVRVVNDKNGVYMVSRTAELCKEFIYYRNKIAPAKLSIEDIDNNYVINYITGETINETTLTTSDGTPLYLYSRDSFNEEDNSASSFEQPTVNNIDSERALFNSL